MHLSYECAIQEEGLLQKALLYYRLVGSWLLKLAEKGDGETLKMLPGVLL